MKKAYIFLIILSVLILSISGVRAGDEIVVNKNAAIKFAQLPEGIVFPEGITANPDSGDIYVSTFDFGGNNKLLRLSKNGLLLAQKNFAGTPLLGLAFNAQDDKIYICNLGSLVGGQSKIQRIDSDSR